MMAPRQMCWLAVTLVVHCQAVTVVEDLRNSLDSDIGESLENLSEGDDEEGLLAKVKAYKRELQEEPNYNIFDEPVDLFKPLPSEHPQPLINTASTPAPPTPPLQSKSNISNATARDMSPQGPDSKAPQAAAHKVLVGNSTVELEVYRAPPRPLKAKEASSNATLSGADSTQLTKPPLLDNSSAATIAPKLHHHKNTLKQPPFLELYLDSNYSENGKKRQVWNSYKSNLWSMEYCRKFQPNGIVDQRCPCDYVHMTPTGPFRSLRQTVPEGFKCGGESCKSFEDYFTAVCLDGAADVPMTEAEMAAFPPLTASKEDASVMEGVYEFKDACTGKEIFDSSQFDAAATKVTNFPMFKGALESTRRHWKGVVPHDDPNEVVIKSVEKPLHWLGQVYFGPHIMKADASYTKRQLAAVSDAGKEGFLNFFMMSPACITMEISPPYEPLKPGATPAQAQAWMQSAKKAVVRHKLHKKQMTSH